MRNFVPEIGLAALAVLGLFALAVEVSPRNRCPPPSPHSVEGLFAPCQTVAASEYLKLQQNQKQAAN